MQITNEIKQLFELVRVKLGAPIRTVELTDDQLCILLDSVVGDYAEKVQNWIIEYNWLNLNGQKTNIFLQNPQELAYAMTTRMFDYSRELSYLFSREVGLQQRGSFELKKDFIQIEKGKQCYIIPAGREVNKVLYVTPSTTKAALYGNLGTLDTGMAGGFGQYGNMGNGLGITGFYVGSAYDTALMATDLKYKNSLLRGDLAYKITAGPEGTHILHLLSTPGSPNMVGGVAADDTWGWNKYANCVVWYTYYDVDGASEEDVLNCRIQNKDDILLTPDQVPLERMHYELMNYPTQQTIKRLLIAESMLTLAMIRGKFSGKISIPDAEAQLDYSMLREMGQNEKEKVYEELKTRLENMLPWTMMKNYQEMLQSQNEILKLKPLPGTFMVR